MEEELEEKLALRIQLFRESGQVRAEVAEFVEGELRRLARAGLPVSEETAGMLTSHLMMALNRLLNGESLEDPAAGDQMAAELAARPGAVRLARQMSVRAEQALGTAPLPEAETGYLAMHLAVLAQRGPAAGAGEGVREGTPVQQNGEQP
ncbi:hypothetical protein DB35_11735 [Streptomyces abyssalis]|uniref:PRD domain-containing protein n=1 Tax=Streptomyces abyssalis TaxID=933944 RepID=A0A1E7JHF2_9ACTN|nr:PRD domain-containing protein [Streptomyces abyssalis]OEU85880.1 hypothetical protein AN215_26195 [Streptomyces abyssalis]OEU92655.1 hypothetical protein DB35_11735 [Streptomyces abyssalis]